MKRKAFWLVLVTLVRGIAAYAAGHDVVRDRVEALIETSGADVSVAFRTLDGEQELLIEPDELFHAAGSMKPASPSPLEQ